MCIRDSLQAGVEKITKIMMLVLLALMVVLACNSIMMENSGPGLEFYLKPDFGKIDVYKRQVSARSLKIKRNVITKLLDNGLYPYTKRYLGTFENHFSTIGLVGMNEAGLNARWLRMDMTHKETQEFTKKVLNHMRERLSD